MFDRNPNKKQAAAAAKKNRVVVPFNTGTRTHKSKKAYDRKKSLNELKKIVDRY